MESVFKIQLNYHVDSSSWGECPNKLEHYFILKVTPSKTRAEWSAAFVDYLSTRSMATLNQLKQSSAAELRGDRPPVFASGPRLGELLYSLPAGGRGRDTERFTFVPPLSTVTTYTFIQYRVHGNDHGRPRLEISLIIGPVAWVNSNGIGSHANVNEWFINDDISFFQIIPFWKKLMSGVPSLIAFAHPTRLDRRRFRMRPVWDNEIDENIRPNDEWVKGEMPGFDDDPAGDEAEIERAIQAAINSKPRKNPNPLG